jgi:hypothetical protein
MLKLLVYNPPVQAYEFGEDIRLPISIDEVKPLLGHLPSFVPLPPLPFTFKMRDAIRAVERHVFVEGLTDNPSILVESSVAAFTWEFDTYWKVDPARNAYYPRIPKGLQLTSEHVTHAGEIIAEGIALQFLEDRLGVSRANCRFIAPNGKKARLDYAFTPIYGTSLAVLHPSSPKMQLEVRSRKELSKLGATDRNRLTKKKDGKTAGHTLAIYCCYGEPSTDFTPHIILADPGEIQFVSDDEAIETTLINYERITARIGLWRHNYLLRRAIRQRQIDAYLAPLIYEASPEPPHDPPVIRRPRDTRRYKGRYFSQRILEAEQGVASAREALRLINSGNLGTLTFHGLNVEVLRLIENQAWLTLGNFLDRWRTDEGVVTGDGVYRTTEPLDDAADIMEVRRVVARGAEPSH